jgi:hypothetical protein
MGAQRIGRFGTGETRDWGEVGLRAVVAGCGLASAWIHLTMGGLLFTMNAAGYLALAVALVIPLDLARRARWLTRLALLGFTSATILGWLLMGARFPLAYIDKAIEVVLIGFLLADIWRADGPPWQTPLTLIRELPFRRDEQAKPQPVPSSTNRPTNADIDEPPHRKVA